MSRLVTIIARSKAKWLHYFIENSFYILWLLRENNYHEDGHDSEDDDVTRQDSHTSTMTPNVSRRIPTKMMMMMSIGEVINEWKESATAIVVAACYPSSFFHSLEDN